MFPTLAPVAVIICLLFIPIDEPGFPEPSVDWRTLPAVVSVYDPLLCHSGDPDDLINCDDDPGHFATGIAVGPEWYGRAAACDPRLLGATISFPAIDVVVECVDTGGAIGERWSPAFERDVVVFDVMVDLTNEPAPDWSYWLIDGWLIEW